MKTKSILVILVVHLIQIEMKDENEKVSGLTERVADILSQLSGVFLFM